MSEGDKGDVGSAHPSISRPVIRVLARVPNRMGQEMGPSPHGEGAGERNSERLLGAYIWNIAPRGYIFVRKGQVQRTSAGGRSNGS